MTYGTPSGAYLLSLAVTGLVLTAIGVAGIMTSVSRKRRRRGGTGRSRRVASAAGRALAMTVSAAAALIGLWILVNDVSLAVTGRGVLSQ